MATKCELTSYFEESGVCIQKTEVIHPNVEKAEQLGIDPSICEKWDVQRNKKGELSFKLKHC